MKPITDKETFSIITLWLHGFSVLKIKNGMHILESAVQSVIRSEKNGGYLPKNRSDMTQEERQALLNELQSNKFNDGSIPAWMFKAIPLTKKTQDGSMTRGRKSRKLSKNTESSWKYEAIQELMAGRKRI